MKGCFSKILLPLAVTGWFLGMTFTGCTQVDDTLGMGLLPDDQEMIFKMAELDGIGTYLTRTDSIPVNQYNMSMLGSYYTNGFGNLEAGWVIQYSPYYFEHEDYYGYLPSVDSVHLYLSIARIYGDTSQTQTFNIYRLTESPDRFKLYYNNYPAEDIADMENPLFSFTMKGDAPGTIVTKTLEIKDAGKDFLNELTSISADIYENEARDSVFRDVMHGFYIAEAPENRPANGGALYIISPLTDYYQSYYLTDYTYFSVFAHNHYQNPNDRSEDDEQEPHMHNGTAYYTKDTLVVDYSFDDTYLTYNNANIPVVKWDYNVPGMKFSPSDFIDTEKFETDKPVQQEVIYVQGLNGAAGYLDFGDEFLRQLKELCVVDGVEHLMMVNRARLYIYLEDDTNDNLDAAPPRLGMYTSMKGYYPANISDYYYLAEEQSYSIYYNGYLNRSQGYYEMDISMYIRSLANETSETQKQIWLGPPAGSRQLYYPPYVALQNHKTDLSGQPHPKRIQLKLAYTLLKKSE